MDRIAYFEPVKGLNVYGCELLPHLGRHFQIDVYTNLDGDLYDTEFARSFPMYDYQAFSGDRHQRYTHLIYQLRNNGEHVPIYDLLVRHPGVTVLHDLNISGIFGAKTLMQGRRIAFLLQVLRQEGIGPFAQSGLDVALHKRWPSESRYLMNRGVCRASRGLIVHNEQARAALEPIAGDVPLGVVCRGVPVVEDDMDLALARCRLNISQHAFLVTSMGYVTERKRISQALVAFARLARQVPHARYILVGRAVEDFDVQSLIQDLGLSGRVQLTGWVSDDRFYDYLAAADVCINLRYPVEGETSSVALRAMSYAKPTLVSDAGSLSELPDGVCIKIEPGPGEVSAIFRALMQLERDEHKRITLGQRAQRYVRDYHSWTGAARAYYRFLEQLVPEKV